MILACSSCQARYLVADAQIGPNGRKVRCARCKHEWYASLPAPAEVKIPEPNIRAEPVKTGGATPTKPDEEPSKTTLEQEPPVGEVASPEGSKINLPALIKKYDVAKYIRFVLKYMKRIFLVITVPCVLLAWPIMDRQAIVKTVPELRGFYEKLGFTITHSGKGLVFEDVRSELRYDSGTMRLFVDGRIHNNTEEIQLIPNIVARALGPDHRIILSWWMDAPAANVPANGDVPFHTEIAAPDQRTIEDVYLEFYAEDERGNVSK